MRISDWSSDVCSSDLRSFDKLRTNGFWGSDDGFHRREHRRTAFLRLVGMVAEQREEFAADTDRRGRRAGRRARCPFDLVDERDRLALPRADADHVALLKVT